MQNKFAQFEQRFRDYSETFRDSSGEFPFPVRQKLRHTFDVCRITEELCIRSRIPEKETFLFRVCALFHDISRFEQYQKFGTFRDAETFDHGERSAEIMLSGGFIAELSGEEQALAASAIRMHNKPAIPADYPAEYLPAAKMIRDADKLSILTIICEFFNNPDQSDPAFRLELPQSGHISEHVVQAVLDSKPVLYSTLRSVQDFIATLYNWTADLNYPASSAYALEHKSYEKLSSLLPEVPEKQQILNLAFARLQANTNKKDSRR